MNFSAQNTGIGSHRAVDAVRTPACLAQQRLGQQPPELERCPGRHLS